MKRSEPQLPFGMQRVVFFALLLGMAMYAIVVAVLLQTNGNRGYAPEPIPGLEHGVLFIAISSAVVALVLRTRLRRTAEAATDPDERSQARFRATLVPLAVAEGGCLTALTAWLLTGNHVPNLVAALVLLSLAIAIVPFHDPDAGA